MTKAERIIRIFCNYVIDHKVKLNDPEEDDYGQCVSELELSEILKGTNIKMENVTINDLALLANFRGAVYRDNDENGKYYGELFYLVLIVVENDIRIEIWDGF